MTTRTEFVNKTREYIDTPFHHAGRTKGRGVDCIGLLLCVTKDLDLFNTEINNYPKVPIGNYMLEYFDRYVGTILDKISSFEEVLPGDILVIKFKYDPQHVAIVSNNNYIIHALANIGKVSEHIIDTKTRNNICAIYRIKDLVE